MFKPCLIIPVYNHQHSIVEILKAIDLYNLPCILVNDGSDESCSHVLEQQNALYDSIELITHDQNRGKGAAVKTGLRAAEKAGFTHALQVDADGQHHLEDIPLFISKAQQYPTAIINGIPIYDESIPKHRFYARYLTHILVWIHTLSIRITDSMCGFRAYPLASTIELLDQHYIGDRMDFDTDILVKIFWSGAPIIEMPTKVHYPESGISHFNPFNDNALISLMHCRLFLGMLLRLPKLLGKRRVLRSAHE